MSDGSGSDHAPRVHRASGRASSIDHGIAAHVGQSLRASAMSAVSAISEKIEVGTVFGTALNTMCNVIGAGVLSLPLAFYRASLGFAVVLTLIMSVVGIFSAYVLFVGCDRTGAFFMNECFAIALIGKRRPIRTDLDAVGGQGNDFIDENNEAEIAAEKKKEFYRTVLSMMVDGCILVNNYLCLAVYCGIILDSIPSVLRQFVHADGIWVEKITWVVIAGVVFFALTSVRNMDELKWTSLLGVATILWAIFAVFLQYCMHGYQGPDVPGDRPEIIYFEVKSSFAAAFGTLALAYGYHYNIPIFYHELQDRSPRKMMKSVAIAFPVITISYVLTGVIGYLSFAQHVDDNDAHGVIINNYGTYNTVINTVRLGLFFHFACVYPVLGVCVRHSLHRFILTFMGRRKEALDKNMPALVPRWAIVSEAFLLVSTSSALAYLYPNVGQLINIVGDLCSSHLMVTIPGIIGMCIWAPRDYGKALLDEDHSRLESVSQDGSDVADYPPPLWNHRKLMYGLCTGLTVFGLVLTIISFYSTLM